MTRRWLRIVCACVLLAARPASALVSVAETSLATTSSSAVTSVSVPRPASLSNGQVMLAVLADRIGSTGSVSAAPSGWTLLQSVASSGELSLKVYLRVVSNAAAEPAAYTWTLNGSARASGAIMTFSGANTVAPVDTSSGQAAAASTTYRAPSLTTSGADRLVIAFFTAANGNATTNTPAGMTSVFDSGGSGAGPNGAALAADQVAQPTAGASGNKDSTGNSAVINAGVLVALVPAIATGPDHYELSLPSTSLACLPTTVTVTACANASSPCTSAATSVNGATATLATSGATLGSGSVTFNASGVATTTLSYPGASDGAAVSVTLSGESTAASNARQCCPNGSSCVTANSCSTTFSSAGFIVAGSAGGGAATIPTQTAGTASATYTLRAVKTSGTTQACEAALSGSTTVNWAYECNDPGSCSGSNLMSVTGSPTAPAQRNNNGALGAYLPVTMSFDANGNAPFSFNFADVGRVTLWVSKTVNGATLAGGSNAFVVKPAGFTLSAIQQAASPNLANPAAASATGASFVKAGESFRVTVKAVTAGGAVTPNFGKESIAEGVLLTPALVLPAGGAAGALANSTVAGSGFTSGVATATTLSYSEVGIVTLTPSIADGDYLGGGAVTSAASGNIGRFVPAKFALAAPTVTHRAALACSPASTFSYLGENFRIGFTLTAQNTAGATTQNYTGSFAKLDPATAMGWNLAGIDGSTVFAIGGRLSLGSATGSWSAGAAAVTLTANAGRAATPDGPFNATFGIAPVDSDGVAMAAFDLASASGGSNDRTAVGSVGLRFGRLRLLSAMGAADRDLSLPAAAQYWSGTNFATNTLDSCSTVPASAVSFGNLRRTLTTADTTVTGAIVISDGIGALKLIKPAAGHSGTVDVALSLGSAAADASCLQPWTPGAGDAATAGANLSFLRGAWCGANFDKDPSARASFGLPRGQDAWVYRRENY